MIVLVNILLYCMKKLGSCTVYGETMPGQYLAVAPCSDEDKANALVYVKIASDFSLPV